MAITATAAVLRAKGGPLSVEDTVVEDPRPDEVRVRLVGSGVCHTDLGVVATAVPEQLPIILGHEGSGVVESIGGDVTGLAPGDHVVLSYAYCGECDNCRCGVQMHCRSFMGLNFGGARADGSTAYRAGGDEVHGHFFGQSSWSQYVVTSPRNVVKVDPSLPLEILGPLGCGIQTGAGAVLNTLDPRAGSSLAVFATGSVGLSAVMAAKVAGCGPVIAVDPDPRRRALALELGATHALDPSGEGVVEEINDITKGGADYSVDCLGLPSVVRRALECLASPGVCASVGFQGVDNDISFNQGHLLFGRTLVGVIEGDADPHAFIPRLLDLFQAGRLPFDRLIQTFPIVKINDAVEAAQQGQVVKAVVTFGD
ncbi:NAD(P)-dependent alcohol dehydrogenase [Streptomyces sp. NPDC101455]|uniref:NAD(P)-dependent alcohol dehydrogenase n=1 Tax=Streptomyces sp. NPDC101455 TaxID=3366142 RepID=UPI003812AAE3